CSRSSNPLISPGVYCGRRIATSRRACRNPPTEAAVAAAGDRRRAATRSWWGVTAPALVTA
ncbi:MAG: hypothetical protein KAJ97_08855, partial [Acidobacteria bacterium]|nr:hypothetical protein [Acidobacteriota bacterium]